MNKEIRIQREDRRSLAMVAGPDGLVVRVPCGLTVDDAQVRDFIRAGLGRLGIKRARQDVEPMSRDEARALVGTWAERIGVEVARVQIRPMCRKWASCSSRGTLTLASDLLEVPQELVEYVICHDLIHLRVPDHGKGFQAMMNAHMADWKEREEALAVWVLRSISGTGRRHELIHEARADRHRHRAENRVREDDQCR